MCFTFCRKKKQKKPDERPQIKMPCWTLFHSTPKDSLKGGEGEDKKVDKSIKNITTTTTTTEGAGSQVADQANTPSLEADLPSVSVISIGGNQDQSLSNPLKSAAFEWNNHSSRPLRTSPQTKETTKVKTEMKLEKEKNQLLSKFLKDGKG